jgi:hypothetical protein
MLFHSLFSLNKFPIAQVSANDTLDDGLLDSIIADLEHQDRFCSTLSRLLEEEQPCAKVNER